MADSEHRLNSSLSDANFKLSCASVLDKLVPLGKASTDAILAHDDPQKPEIVLPDGRRFIWYLAIGSMINPISLYLRELTPIVSYPAVCLDYQLVFRGSNGMGDIEPCADATFHGVVHLLSEEQMIRLDKVENMYRRVAVTVVDYQEQTHLAYAYKMDLPNQALSIPTERYLDVIVKGCEYYEVQPEYIDRMKRDQTVIPRKQPNAFQSFSNIPPDAFYTIEELGRHNGSDPSLPVWVGINGKIVEYAGVPPNDHPDYEQQRRFYAFFQPLFAGKVVDHGLAKGLYEPLYKLPLTDADLTDEHRAMLEDIYINLMSRSENTSPYWKPIGRIRTIDKSKKSRLCILL